MLIESIILVLMALAGFLGEAWWFMLLGALGLSIDTLCGQYQLLRNSRKVPREWNVWRQPAASIGSGLACAAASYFLGWTLGSFVF